MSKTLLIVHHTPSPHTQEMFEAVVAGATDPEIEGVEVVRRAALVVSPKELLEADGYLLGTPANLGYMSGTLLDNSINSTLHGGRGLSPCTGPADDGGCSTTKAGNDSSRHSPWLLAVGGASRWGYRGRRRRTGASHRHRARRQTNTRFGG
jgi:hypothetical protein